VSDDDPKMPEWIADRIEAGATHLKMATAGLWVSVNGGAETYVYKTATILARSWEFGPVRMSIQNSLVQELRIEVRALLARDIDPRRIKVEWMDYVMPASDQDEIRHDREEEQ